MVTVWLSAAQLIHYSFLNPRETITSEKYGQQIDETHWKLKHLHLALVSRKGQFFPVTTSDCTLHNQCFRSWTNWAMKFCLIPHQFSSVQLLSWVWLFATPWTATCQASLSITNSWSLPKLMFIESVMPSKHLILCHPLLLLPSIILRIRVFSNESALRIRWPKYCSFSFSISPSNEYSGLIPFRMDWVDLLAVQWILESLL